MIVGVATWELSFPGAASLKDKRMVLKSLKDRIRNRFNVSVAETDFQDVRQRAEISVAVVGTDTRFVDSVLSKVDGFVESETRVVIVGSRSEMW
jgi:uncharacterized protein YlxP (DUF503 family)